MSTSLLPSGPQPAAVLPRPRRIMTRTADGAHTLRLRTSHRREGLRRALTQRVVLIGLADDNQLVVMSETTRAKQTTREAHYVGRSALEACQALNANILPQGYKLSYHGFTGGDARALKLDELTDWLIAQQERDDKARQVSQALALTIERPTLNAPQRLEMELAEITTRYAADPESDPQQMETELAAALGLPADSCL